MKPANFRWLHFPRVDIPLLVGLLLAALIGLAALYSASDQNPATVYRQVVRLGVGFTVLLAFSSIPPRLFRLWTPWAYLLGVLLLAVTLIVGEGRGTNRWLDFGVVRFQPSEIMKLALPMAVAWYLHSRPLPPRFAESGLVVAMVAVPMAIIYFQPDLGTALLVGVSGLFVLYLAGLQWRLMGATAALGLVALPLLWFLMHEYQRNRIRTFLNPENDPLGEGWNIIQSKIAAGSGGLLGKGWLNGTQSHLEFLPESSTDFILSVYAEEFGFFGVAVLFSIYLFIVWRSLWIAKQGHDSYSRLLAGSLAMTFFVYVIVNAAMVSGLLPVVGVPLPLVSYGGTSIVTLLGGFGILMSVYGHRRFTLR